jgi:nicotinamide riboside transporter PnuC
MEASWDMISQVAIFFLGFTSIVLVARKNKWGFVLGLAAQPFWFITSYANGQWGIFLVSFLYAASWIYGIYEWFFKAAPKPKASAAKRR